MEDSTKKKAKLERQRSETLNMRIDPKLKYLAELGAREQQRSLSSFIERAIRRALTPTVMNEDEPTAGVESTKPAPVLWNEGFWDVDEADRFFLLATCRHDLLTIPEQRLWKLFNLGIPGRTVTIEQFREFWNSPSIDTAHLKEGAE
jgi:hypothetical protein